MQYSDVLVAFTVEYGLKFISALVVLLIGLWVIKILNRAIKRTMDKRSIDPTLQPFLRSLISSLFKVLLVITVMSMLGIEMTSFVAILGAAGLAIGLALSGTLQNFAGGVMILILKPFKVGDFIETQGFKGKVKEIQIFNTILNTVDNRRVIIPNGGLSTGSMVNYTAEPTRRLDITFGISYGDDVDKAKKVIHEAISADERVLKDPPVFVKLAELGDSSVNLAMRVWVATEDYWDVHFDAREKVYAALNANKISIPFPQMDVHLHKKD
ncbi:MAG TPA: mechanosensitive ion channel protein MscS [Flavobacteriales bacterium]|nr:mechanosensitive ion channel protein MscS [Flavobacteriales bacterium]